MAHASPLVQDAAHRFGHLVSEMAEHLSIGCPSTFVVGIVGIVFKVDDHFGHYIPNGEIAVNADYLAPLANSVVEFDVSSAVVDLLTIFLFHVFFRSAVGECCFGMTDPLLDSVDDAFNALFVPSILINEEKNYSRCAILKQWKKNKRSLINNSRSEIDGGCKHRTRFHQLIKNIPRALMTESIQKESKQT